MMQKILDETKSLAERFRAQGHEIYLVGGIVRNLFLHPLSTRELSADEDLDLCTSAKPDQTKNLLKGFVENLWSVGERFGTIGCIYQGKTYEITTFRKEAYDPKSRKPNVDFGTNILEDLERRDFTINAMAISLPDGELIDPHNGQEDLKQKILKSPIDPEILFREDPLRMLRAARFEAQLGFTPSAQVLAAMSAMGERIQIVSKERCLEELRRLLTLPDPTAGITRLKEVGLLQKVLPDATYSDKVLLALSDLPPNFNLRLAAFYLDAFLTGRSPPLRTLRLSKADSKTVSQILNLAKQALQTSTEEIRALTRALTAGAGAKEIFEQALALVNLENAKLAGEINAQFEALFSVDEDLYDPVFPLTSQEIMQILDITPGPKIKEAQNLLQELYFKKGKLTRRQAMKELKKRLR